MPRREAAALLGVRDDATAHDVQRAYLRAARRTHPDTLPDADEAGRRAAADAFDLLTRARDALLAELQVDPLQRAQWSVRPDATDVAASGRTPGRGLGGSLVVLALLAFLLVGLVSLQQAFEGGAGDSPSTSTTP